MLDFQKLSATYQQALLRQAVPFWLKNSRDKQCGGYFDLISTTGEPIDGDKFTGLQAQQAWAFAWLFNTIDGQSDWLDHAQHGASFLSQFAHDDSLACYAQLDRRGKPVSESTTLVPDCLVIMAYAQLYRATREDEWAMLAKQTFATLIQRREDARARELDTLGGFRQIRQLAEPVAMLKMLLDMQPLLAEDVWKQHADAVVQEILHEFMDRRTETLREHILPEGAFINTPEGRRLNVGLTFQTASHLLDFYAESASVKSGTIVSNRRQARQVVTWSLRLCEQAWDEANAGLSQYVDYRQQAFVFPEWHQKWAWVQLEAITALAKGYEHTHHPDCLKWLKRIHEYTFHHFPDAKQAGWHLVLDQYAQPLLPAKAIPSVGCFSLIRCLAETGKHLTKLGQIKERTGRTSISLNS